MPATFTGLCLTPEREACDAATAATKLLQTTLQYQFTKADVEQLLIFAEEAKVAFALGEVTDRAAALLNKDAKITKETFNLEGNKFRLSAHALSAEPKFGIAIPRSGFGGAMGPNLVDIGMVAINPVHADFEATVRGAREAVGVVDQHAEPFVAALLPMLDAGHYVGYHDLLSKINKRARELACEAGKSSYTAKELALLGCSLGVSFQTWTGADTGILTNFSQPLRHWQVYFAVEDPRMLAAQLGCTGVEESKTNVLLHAYAEATAGLVERMTAAGYKEKFVDARALAALYLAPGSPVRAASVPVFSSPDEVNVMRDEIKAPGLSGKRKAEAELRHHAPRQLSYENI